MEDYRKDITRGIWYKIHTDGAAAINLNLMKAYAYNFRNICDKMGCSCENDCKQMLLDLPPEDFFNKYDDRGRHIGCLIHSIRCHNMVNARLGKPLIDEDEAIAIYMGDKEIGGTCKAPIKADKINSSHKSNLSGESSSKSNSSRSNNRQKNKSFKLIIV